MVTVSAYKLIPVQEMLALASFMSGAAMGDVTAYFREAFYRYNTAASAAREPRSLVRYATRTAMLLAEYSRAHRQFADAHTALMRAHFQVGSMATPRMGAPRSRSLLMVSKAMNKTAQLVACDRGRCLQHLRTGRAHLAITARVPAASASMCASGFWSSRPLARTAVILSSGVLSSQSCFCLVTESLMCALLRRIMSGQQSS